jgi:VWFA-related protein
LRRILFLVALCLLAAAPCLAQWPPSGTKDEPQPDTSTTDTQKPLETLKVNVNVVNIYCNVTGKHNALIPDLKKEDFQVFEDDQPQQLKYFSALTDQPLTLGLLMDTSGSMMEVIPAEKQVGGEFIQQLLTPKDEAFFISFDTDVRLLQDLTSSAHRIKEAMESAHLGVQPVSPGIAQGPFPSSSIPTPGTTLYDAIYLAAHDELAQQVGRKAIIIMSDGVDEGSRTRLNEAIAAAQKANVICYVLLFNGGIYGNRGEGVMKKLAEETGGRLFNVGNNFKNLKQAFDQIASELRTQYLLGYSPSNQKQDGSFRKIKIKTINDYHVQARSGYYAPES